MLLLTLEICDLKITPRKEEIVKKVDQVVNLNSHVVNSYTNIVIGP